jgi:phenylalanyl-tRNA synthetase beta chain
VKIVHQWLAELVKVPDDVNVVAREISLRGFEVASVDNGVIDFEITANRPDCLSHDGIAREAAVIWPQESRAHLTALVTAAGQRPPITIESPDLCPRYAALEFDVKVGPSPEWLAKRLDAAGVRSINNVVDVTNYVMLEMGQPMHAFDFDKLAEHRIVVRRARPGETITTLDGVERALDEEMCVIADAARAIAIGGVMGGLETEIGPSTKRMLLESAYFLPTSVRRTSKRLGLKTEASIRFERGADLGAPDLALGRAAQLLEKIGAGNAGSTWDVFPSPPTNLRLTLRASRIRRVLGMTVPNADVPRILGTLGFGVEPDGADAWTVTVPSFRPDVVREVDLIEEVGRHHGFDKLPTTFPALTAAQATPDERIERDRKLRNLLTAAGLSESMTFAFIERQAALPFCAPGTEPTAIANPLSEKFAVLRPSLLPGLIDSCSHNRRRGRKDVRLFETGSRFTAAGENRAVGLAWTGAGHVAHWSAPPAGATFFDVKGVVELLCDAFGLTRLEFTQTSVSWLVPGRCAEVRTTNGTLGYVGLLAPAIAEARGMPAGEDVYVAELDVDAVASAIPRAELRTESLPKFPPIVRDVSILVSEALPAAAVRGTIRAAAPPTLESVVEFDRYQGKGVAEGRVSLSLRLTFRSAERTLTDAEVEGAMHTIVDALRTSHGAERR